MKRIAILGSTGSIGVNALKVIDLHRDRFAVTALAAGRNVGLLKEQIERFRPRVAAVLDAEAASALQALLHGGVKTEILHGQEGYRAVAAETEAQTVLSAMVGAAGLIPTLAAVEAGKDVALANKESLVVAGEHLTAAVRERGVRVIPVDSEHSAVFQCLEGQRRDRVRRIVLTASGGPFRRLSAAELEKVTPEEALCHPNWRMGKKITIDSATMMNKGLEVIEAHWLFGRPYDGIEVVIHPQSIVHSLVEYEDGSFLAQLGLPDMRVPIAYALAYPDRITAGVPSLDLTALSSLTFERTDGERFPCLRLAYEAGRAGGNRPAVMNAANEKAVEAFLSRRIPFKAIPRVIERTLETVEENARPTVEDLLWADGRAREIAEKIIRGISS
ncbi:MAG TPA: 1-deoxy-D-xylulose-5-phosphate reductoisomerase [Syntrophales bacterium]|nr:1-deoxy-D-xylulose-5-phosphate reductoisomerase [Syntrophales bacterium]HOM06981.1 1-deoxy-D-xylulose-5-phosphate reductoisomerase [Syntrophales bacterium]HON98841.1 1-deoxy-D-xylulose-5-phosphate reductoisomerase [Syntrophales bacterium]HPC00899.1 1-deoxy-D-xylulose-5-phosphate reductoisomerase [Syntrophales bacterium]HPQ06521.1 1-deoxy-D-xylulose-5-phosphate reductoisomerase [Syntrophales bacterium]